MNLLHDNNKNDNNIRLNNNSMVVILFAVLNYIDQLTISFSILVADLHTQKSMHVFDEKRQKIKQLPKPSGNPKNFNCETARLRHAIELHAQHWYECFLALLVVPWCTCTIYCHICCVNTLSVFRFILIEPLHRFYDNIIHENLSQRRFCHTYTDYYRSLIF